MVNNMRVNVMMSFTKYAFLKWLGGLLTIGGFLIAFAGVIGETEPLLGGIGILLVIVGIRLALIGIQDESRKNKALKSC